MQSATSIFDPNTFLETTHKGGLDTTYVLPEPGDYPAQVTDRMGVRSGRVGEDKERAGEVWATLDLNWELLDDTVKSKLNMDHVIVRQSLMLDLTKTEPPQIDWGTNKNMRLRRLLDATGLNSNKNFQLGGLKFASALVHVEHRPDKDDPTIVYAEVTRVAPLNGRG